MAFSRISITLPRPLLVDADRRARALGRSRSWVLAEALQGYLAVPLPQAVSEPAPPGYGVLRPGLGESRLTQLKSDLALTPEQRVIEAERSADLANLVHPRPKAHHIITFYRYEDYVAWKRRDAVGL